MLWVGVAMSLSRVEISVSRYQYPQLKMSIGALGMMAAVILAFSFVLQSF